MDNSQLADTPDEPDSIIPERPPQASPILPLYPVEPEIFISKVDAARAVLAARTTSDRAQRIHTAFLTRLGTGHGGWRLASFIASSDHAKVEQMSDHLWTALLVPSSEIVNSYA